MSDKLLDRFKEHVKKSYGYEVKEVEKTQGLKFEDIFGMSFFEQNIEDGLVLPDKSENSMPYLVDSTLTELNYNIGTYSCYMTDTMLIDAA